MKLFQEKGKKWGPKLPTESPSDTKLGDYLLYYLNQIIAVVGDPNPHLEDLAVVVHI